jgi:guanylate kinase
MENDKNLKFLKSCSTRKPRRGSKDYYFFSEKEMAGKIKKGELFEFEQVHGYIYGVLNKSVDKMIKSKNHYIKDIGVIGQKKFKENLNDKIGVLSIFLDCDNDILRSRLIDRG